MKYFIRLIAAVPAFGVGFSIVALFTLAFDYHWLVLPVIGNALALIILLDNFEGIVRGLQELIRILVNKTLV